MGTRGLMGIRINGQDKFTYNHFDSYPDGLGKDMVADIKSILQEKGLLWLEDKAKSLVLVQQNSKPTDEQKEKYRVYADTAVGTRSIDEWYCLLRELQGKLRSTLEANIMIDSHSFINESLFCEWAYVVNLDDKTFEVYKGFQDEPHQKGRYAKDTAEAGYYPCALVATYPLTNIPDGWEKQVDKEQ